MSEEPSEVHSIGGASPRPTPTLLGDCEERGEEDTRRPRRVSASVNIRGFYEDHFTRLRSCEVARLRGCELKDEEESYEIPHLCQTTLNIFPIRVQYRVYQQLFRAPVFLRIFSLHPTPL